MQHRNNLGATENQIFNEREKKENRYLAHLTLRCVCLCWQTRFVLRWDKHTNTVGYCYSAHLVAPPTKAALSMRSSLRENRPFGTIAQGSQTILLHFWSISLEAWIQIMLFHDAPLKNRPLQTWLFYIIIIQNVQVGFLHCVKPSWTIDHCTVSVLLCLCINKSHYVSSLVCMIVIMQGSLSFWLSDDLV